MKIDSDRAKINPAVPCIILLDNGSRRAASTINLRHLADGLSEKEQRDIHPVSLLHSDKVAPSELNGQPAQILEPFLLSKLSEGVNNFLILPLFFGKTAAVYEYIPQRLEVIRKDYPNISVQLASCLVKLESESDHSMAKILASLVRDKVNVEGLARPGVILVDHGTPRISVNKVRNLVSRQLREELSGDYGEVKPASMERREGEQYDFNEPLLENLLGSEGFTKDVVVALLFCSPGRHAGDGGDIPIICKNAEEMHPGLKVYTTALPSSEAAFLDILALRLNEALSCSV